MLVATNMTTQHTPSNLENNPDFASPLSRHINMDTSPAQDLVKDSSPKSPTSTRDAHISSETQSPKDINALPDELLMQILLEVPEKQRVSIRGVSKKWMGTIRDVGYHLEPLFVRDTDSLPYYTTKAGIRYNPAIMSMDSLTIDNVFPAGGKPFTRNKLLSKRSEFITSPPISMVSVIIWKSEISSDIVPMVVRTATPASKGSEGIRLGDLIDVIESVQAWGPGCARIRRVKVTYDVHRERVLTGYCGGHEGFAASGNFEVLETASGIGKVEVRAWKWKYGQQN